MDSRDATDLAGGEDAVDAGIIPIEVRLHEGRPDERT
jgi:hypothetical protein